jgi:hypothetical protein
MMLARRVWRVLTRRYERQPWFALLATGCFACLQVLGHLDHEPWRDELHCWGVARASDGFWDTLTGERRYDGHPFLWYYLLSLAARIDRSYIGLHVVTIALIVGAAYLWLRWAPFPRPLRLLLLGSYYFLYEYGVLSRSYTLGILFVFAFCALYHPLRVRYVLLSVVLSLLAATSLYGTLMACCLGLFLFGRGLRYLPPDDGDDRGRIALPIGWVLGLCLFGLGLLFTAMTTWPPEDSAFAPSWRVDLTTALVRSDLSRYWQTLFPYKQWNDWNWLYVDYFGHGFNLDEADAAWLGAAWLFGWLLVLLPVPLLAAGYALGILAMMAVQHGIYPAALRHMGHYWILLLACLWLCGREQRVPWRRGRLRAGLFWLGQAMLGANLLVQVATGYAAMSVDHQAAFSGAVAAARFMRLQHLTEGPIVGSNDHSSSAVAIVLDRAFLFQETGETSDVVVEHNRRTPADGTRTLMLAMDLARKSGSALIVSNYDLIMSVPEGFTITILYRGPPAIVFDESYRVYRVEYYRASPLALGEPG